MQVQHCGCFVLVILYKYYQNIWRAMLYAEADLSRDLPAVRGRV
nr:MAG TPA: hypothetical protein [Caudoviricetes sp.]